MVQFGGRFDDALFDEALFDQPPCGILTSLRIADVEYLDKTHVPDFVLAKEINGAIGTLDFKLRLPAGDPGVRPGNAVRLNSVDGTLFDGYIARLSPMRINPDVAIWGVTCQDHARLLSSVLIGTQSFTDQTDKYIIQYLFAAHLSQVDVTTYVNEVTTIPSIDLSGKTLLQCMQAIAGLTQAVWYLDTEMRLHYFEKGEEMSPFSLTEAAEDATSGGILVDPPMVYTEDFSNPCNKATVRNMLSEDTTVVEYTPGASGDDGDVYKSDGSWPPGGTATAVTDGETVTIRRQLIQPGSSNINPSAAQKGTPYCYSIGYPPSGTPGYSASSPYYARRSKNYPFTSDYYVSSPVLSFNTGGIPDTATITSTQLELTGTSATNTDGLYIGVEWYTPSFSTADYEFTPSNTAWGYNYYTGALGAFDLSNTSGINKTGYTGLRIHSKLFVTPTGINALSFTDANLTVYYTDGGDTYKLTCAMMRVDTSGLPDGSTITGATLKVNVTSKTDVDGASLGVEYYDSANWPIEAGDYTETPAQDAVSYKALSTISSSGWLNLPLNDPDSNISKTGYTGFRFHLYTSGAPTGDNQLTIATQDSSDDPELEITYIPGEMIVGTEEDTDSQAEYGLFEKSYLNTTVVTQAQAEQQALAVVAKGSWPGKALNCTVMREGIEIGDLVHVVLPSLNIDADFLTRRITMTPWAPGRFYYTLDLGDFRESVVLLLREINLTAAGINTPQF
jgi:hypothetical protein